MNRMTNSVYFDAEAMVLVVVRTDNSYDVHDGTLLVSKGTRLIGTWAAEQPDDKTTCAVIVGETTWHFPIESIVLSHVAEQTLPWQEQERIASESLARAQAQEAQHPAESARLYACALIEMEACGKSAVELADVRHKRAFLLKKVGNSLDALNEFERLARAYEAIAVAAGYDNVDRDYAELATQAFNTAAYIILHDTDPNEESIHQNLPQIVHRMLFCLKYIARRYDTKAEVLLTASEVFHFQGNTNEALSLFEQADTLYHQKHLGSATGNDGISLHLARLRKILGGAAPKRRAQIQTARRKRKGTKS